MKTAEAKIAQILAGLTENRCLLVLDNLEDILYPASHREAGKAVSSEWGELLQSFVYSRHCSTIIITSRELPVDLADRRSPNPKPNPKLVKVCPVDGVADEDGVEILRQNGSRDCEADLKWIAERVKGNALILTLLGSIGASSPGDLRKQPELVTEEAELIIRAQLERQSEVAQELLKRMCVLRAGIDVQGLTFLRLYEPESKDERFEKAVQLGKPVEFTKVETKETEEIIKRLVNSSLVQHRYDQKRCEHFYDLHRLIGEFLQAEYETELRQLWERAYKFYRTDKIIETPKTLEDLHSMIEAQHFAFKLKKYNAASNLLIGKLERCLESWGYWSFLKRLYEESLLYVPKDEYPYYLERIGLRNRDIGEWKKAEKYYQIALTITAKQNNEYLTASLQEHLGDLEKLRGNLDHASHLYNQALNIRLNLRDRSGIASCWGQLGEIERYRGNWEEAKYYYSTSLELQVPSDLSARVSILGVLGAIELKQENWEQAKSFYNEALQLRTELGDRSGMATFWAGLGDIERFRGNWEEAERLYRQCLEVQTELGDRSGMAISIGCLGANELAKGNLDVAEEYLTQALSTMQELGMSWEIAETNYDFAQLWRKRGNPEKAQEYYTTAHQLYQKLGAVKDLEKIEREWNSPE
ncbi:tetratricopeptide repeat protein [Oscillatoria laete-virens NRMC-F 0139]|nr:tetratricopeptide repeat protein [Oscillatoria laete-virens]MDL5052497.1 tetratricopeptide repeat protein [Oscillatoria laete-virens NRMC-F 0139]